MAISISEQRFEQDVLQATVPVIVNFWAPWCGLCRFVDPVLSQLETRSPLPFSYVRINADENFFLTKKYQLTTLPTILLFEHGGLVHRVENFQDPGQLRQVLREMLERLPMLSVS